MILKILMIVALGIISNTFLFGQSRKVSLDVTKQPLPNVLEQVGKKSGYNIVYSDDIVSDTMIVTVGARNEEVSAILSSILEPKNLFYSPRENDMIVIGSNKLRRLGLTMAYAATKVSGKIINEEQSPIPFASVTLLKNNNVLIGTACNESGEFEFTFPLKEDSAYILSISSVGYREKEIQFVYPNMVFANSILLLKDKEALKTVTVSTSKPLVERKIDRIVFNVENSVGVLGGDAIDALRITPSLKLTDEAISIIGKSSVKVMVNEKVIPLSGNDLLNYLKSIPAANIKHIEVISNPPSKYEAEGNSGLINIQLKEVKQDSWNVSVRGAYTQATYPSMNGGITYSFKKNKFSILTDIAYNRRKDIYTNNIFYEYPSELWHNQILNKRKSDVLSGLLSLQYQLAKNKTIGFQFSGNTGKLNTLEINDSKSYQNDQIIKDYPTNGVTQSISKNISLNTNYSQKLDSLGKIFSVDIDYFNVNSPRSNDFSSHQRNLQTNTAKDLYAQNNSAQNISNYSAKLDFNMPYEWASLEFGTKVSSTESKNYVHADFFDNPDLVNPTISQKDSFRYSENTEAMYFSINKKLGKKFEAKLGLRGELTQTKSNSITLDSIVYNNYFKVFPTAYFSFKPDTKSTFTTSFGRRISRPGFGYLNPARWYLNPNSYAVGNPFLQPAFIYNYSLSYNYRNSLNVEGYYLKQKNGYSQVVYHDTINNYQVFRRLNFFDNQTFGVTLSYSKRIFPWLETSSQADYYHTRSENFIPLYNKHYEGNGGSISTSNTFTLNEAKTLFSTVYFNYDFPVQSNETLASSSAALNVGFKYLVLNKQLTIGLNFNDILKTNYNTYNSISGGVKQSFTQYYDSRSVRISVSYNFGNKNLSLSSRKVGNQEEKNRSN